jgi:CBS-domain-containing membrane protein
MDSGQREPLASRGLRGFSSRLWDSRFPARASHYFLQCGLATAALFFILLMEDAVFRAAIVVAVASTAFTIFVFPNSVASTPRKVIGGHAVAVVTGSVSAAILVIPTISDSAEQSRYVLDMIAALAVGIGIFIMVVTNTEHPPAAGTALGLVIHDWSWSAVAFIMISALVLSVIRFALRPRLVDLL